MEVENLVTLCLLLFLIHVAWWRSERPKGTGYACGSVRGRICSTKRYPNRRESQVRVTTKFNICSDYRLSVEQLNWDGEEQCDREEFFLSIVCSQISFFPFSKLNEVFIIKV